MTKEYSFAGPDAIYDPGPEQAEWVTVPLSGLTEFNRQCNESVRELRDVIANGQSEQVGDLRAVQIDPAAWDIQDATTASVGMVYKYRGEFVFNGNITSFSRPTLLALSAFVAKCNRK